MIAGIIAAGLGGCETKHATLPPLSFPPYGVAVGFLKNEYSMNKPFSPYGVAVDKQGNLYIADGGRCMVEKVTPSGTLSIVAGSGWVGPPLLGPAVKSPLYEPSSVAIDDRGNLYIADTGNDAVEKVTPSGMISIVIGVVSWDTPIPGPALKSGLNHPSDVAVDNQGNLYIADSENGAVEKVTPSGILSVIVDQGPTVGTPQVVTK